MPESNFFPAMEQYITTNFFSIVVQNIFAIRTILILEKCIHLR